MEPATLFRTLWPSYQPTPLLTLVPLAHRAEVGQVLVKSENERPLGNFKTLGGMPAAILALARHLNIAVSTLLSKRAGMSTRLICATDGNHGLAVAAAALRCGAQARVYLPAAADPLRAGRIIAQGAEVIRIAGTYDDAVRTASAAASSGEGLLISDTTPRASDRVVSDVMRGYGVITEELLVQLAVQPALPTHVFVQAGVGGLAAVIAQGLSSHLLPPREIVIVEPAAAACVAQALEHDRPIHIQGSLATTAEMLSCGVASTLALAMLKQLPVKSLSVPEEELIQAPETLRACTGPRTTSSGAAGVAGLLHVAARASLRKQYGLTRQSRVLLIVTESALE